MNESRLIFEQEVRRDFLCGGEPRLVRVLKFAVVQLAYCCKGCLSGCRAGCPQPAAGR